MLAWLARVPGIETGRDDAKYILLARSLRHFSYREFWRPDAPVHAEYPPGYPLFLALTGLVARDRIDWFLALNIAASVASLWIVYRVLFRRWSWWAALLVLALLAPNPYLVDRAGQVASEPLFMLCGMATVALLAADDQTPRTRLTAGALAIFAAMTRSVGVALVIAIAVLWLLEKRWKTAALFGVASLATVGAWLAWTIHAASVIMGETYVGDAVVSVGHSDHGFAATMIARVGMHLADFLATTLPLIVATPTVPGTIIDNVLGAGVVGICSLVGLLSLWRRWPACVLYVLLTTGLLVVWPFMLIRFFIPLVPLLAAVILAGLAAITLRAPLAWRRVAMAAVLLPLTGSAILRSAALVRHRSGCQRGSWPPAPSCSAPDKVSVYAAAMWIRAYLPRDAVVVYAKPETLTYYADRRTLPVRLALAHDSTLASQALAAGARWLLLSSVQGIETTALQQRLRQECGTLVLEAPFPPRTFLFRLANTAAADSSGCRAMEDYRRLNRGRDFEADQ